MRRIYRFIIAAIVMTAAVSCDKKNSNPDPKPVADFKVVTSHEPGLIDDGQVLKSPSFTVSVFGDDVSYIMKYSVDGGAEKTTDVLWVDRPFTIKDIEPTYGWHYITGKVQKRDSGDAVVSFRDSVAVRGPSLKECYAEYLENGVRYEFSMKTTEIAIGKRILSVAYKPESTPASVRITTEGGLTVDKPYAESLEGYYRTEFTATEPGPAALKVYFINVDKVDSLIQRFNVSGSEILPPSLSFDISPENTGKWNEYRINLTDYRLENYDRPGNRKFFATAHVDGKEILQTTIEGVSERGTALPPLDVVLPEYMTGADHIISVTLTLDNSDYDVEHTAQADIKLNFIPVTSIGFTVDGSRLSSSLDIRDKERKLTIIPYPSNADIVDIKVSLPEDMSGVSVTKYSTVSYGISPSSSAKPSTAYVDVEVTDRTGNILTETLTVNCLKPFKAQVELRNDGVAELSIYADFPLSSASVTVDYEIVSFGYVSYEEADYSTPGKNRQIQKNTDDYVTTEVINLGPEFRSGTGAIRAGFAEKNHEAFRDISSQSEESSFWDDARGFWEIIYAGSVPYEPRYANAYFHIKVNEIGGHLPELLYCTSATILEGGKTSRFTNITVQ